MPNDLYTGLYNPDVLSCLANLSNDEVFTPPEVANAMLDLLPQELFEVAALYFLQGRKQREIAQILGVGAPLVKYRVRRAREILQRELGEA